MCSNRSIILAKCNLPKLNTLFYANDTQCQRKHLHNANKVNVVFPNVERLFYVWKMLLSSSYHYTSITNLYATLICHSQYMHRFVIDTLAHISTEKTYIHDFFFFFKRALQNFRKIMKICFLCIFNIFYVYIMFNDLITLYCVARIQISFYIFIICFVTHYHF